MSQYRLQQSAKFIEAPGAKAVMAMFCGIALLYTIPENVTDALTLGPLKGQYMACAGATGAILFSWLRARHRYPAPMFVPGFLVAFAYMALIAPMMGDPVAFEWRVYGYDLLTTTGFIGGFLLTGIWPLQKLERLISSLSLVWAGALAVVVAGLLLGVVNPVWRGSDRIHVWSMFHAMNAILASIPLLAVTSRSPSSFWNSVWMRCGSLCLVVLIANTLAAARSILLLLAIAVLISLPPLVSKLNKGIVIVALAFASLPVFFYDPSNGQIAIWRLQRTEIQREQRLTEISWMLDYLGERSLTGTGFGSKFPSPVRYNNEEYAAYPHVAIFTPLLKGGVVGFGLIILVPLIQCIKGLSSATSNPFRYAAAASMLVYFSMASLSGGWNYPTLLYFGIATGLEWRARGLRRTPESRLGVTVPQPESLSSTWSSL